MSSVKIGVLGSAFDPPTLGHRNVIVQALEYFHCIVLVPSFRHAFRKYMSPFEMRLRLLDNFLEEIKKLGKIVSSDIERKIAHHNSKRPIYTYDVMQALQELYSHSGESVKLGFIIGPDNAVAAQWQRFFRYKDIESKWDVFRAKNILAVRSSMVRSVCKENLKSEILRSKLLRLTTPSVTDFIMNEKMYRKKL